MLLISLVWKRFVFSWSATFVMCVALVAAVVAYVASAGHPHRAISSGAATSIMIAGALFTLATPLAEISVAVQNWTKAFGMVAVGACLGLFTRFFIG